MLQKYKKNKSDNSDKKITKLNKNLSSTNSESVSSCFNIKIKGNFVINCNTLNITANCGSSSLTAPNDICDGKCIEGPNTIRLEQIVIEPTRTFISFNNNTSVNRAVTCDRLPFENPTTCQRVVIYDFITTVEVIKDIDNNNFFLSLSRLPSDNCPISTSPPIAILLVIIDDKAFSTASKSSDDFNQISFFFEDLSEPITEGTIMTLHLNWYAICDFN